MGKSRLLVVEDDIDFGNMMKIYFTGIGFDVNVAVRGSDALEYTKQVLPHVILLDIMLPDIDGYEVCRNLRTNMRTSHIPVIFCTQKDERSDKLQGLELGADDYITKPCDIEEVKLRIQGAIRRSERESLTDPRSGLPAGRLIEEQLRHIIRKKGWALIDVCIKNFEPFKREYGFVAGDDVLRFTGMLLDEVVAEIGNTNDFIGHGGIDNFTIITTEEKVSDLKSRLKERFDAEVQSHYNFIDRQQGFLQALADDGTIIKVPFMTMSVGAVSSIRHSFADIREILEFATESRRLEEQLRFMPREADWSYIRLHIKHFKAYQRIYGFNESNEAIWFTLKMIKDIMSEFQIIESFIGHITADKFIVTFPAKLPKEIRKRIKTRFDSEIISQYPDIHLKDGYVWTEKGDKKLPLLKLSVTAGSLTSNFFETIIELTQLTH